MKHTANENNMNDTTPKKTCWVLDDNWASYPRRCWAPGLNAAGYDIRWCRTASDFVSQVQDSKDVRHPGDVALIDIALDEPVPSLFHVYDQCVQQALTRQGTPVKFHGQAVGLWLWDQRHSLRLPYAYVSSHPGLFIKQLALKPDDE